MGKSKSEVGHVKNMTNYDEVIIILQGMGTLYNPGIPAIQMNNLLIVNQKAVVINEEFKTVTPLFKVAIAERAALYQPLNRLGTRVQNAFKAFRLGDNINETMVSLNKKLSGQRIVKIKKDKPEDEETETISTAQTSFDNKASTFDDMVKFAVANPAYKPNEVDLQTATLKLYHTNIMKANNKASVASVKLLNARKKRNELLYDNPDNILELIKTIKNYLKSLEGAEVYYKEIVKLKFKSKAP
ncbi:MAG: hypothetical protein EOO46_16795 [Flavobacterium sp.]|nr:MAG: hypothetical protein EOO46_16795 [Flavobacterium sp.]